MDKKIKANKNDNELKKYQTVIDYLNEYDRFLTKIAISVKSKCQRLEIEDIKQQLILNLLLNYDKFDNKKNVKNSSYLSQIAINSASNMVRKYWQEKNKANINCLSLDEYVDDDQKNFQFVSYIKESEESLLYPENYLMKKEIESKIDSAKPYLSAFERKVFNLYLAGFEIDKIAKKLKKGKKTIYNALAIAREKIKEKM